MVVDERGMFDQAKYEAYSAVYLSAGYAVMNVGFFAGYAGVLTHVALHHRRALVSGLGSLLDCLRFGRRRRSAASKVSDPNQGAYQDVHCRLMEAYPEGIAGFCVGSDGNERDIYVTY
jgi:hypothetical protein